MGLASQLNRHYKALIHQGKYPICYLCGRPIMKQSEVSQDHAIAKSKGGQTIEANLIVSHVRCNNDKGSLTLQQWFDRQRDN